MVREEVIQVEAAGAFAHEGEAADWLDAALGHLAATDWASLGTTAHGDMRGGCSGRRPNSPR